MNDLIIGDQNLKMINLPQFEASIWAMQNTMEQDSDISFKEVNMQIIKEKTNNVIKSNKCNRCDFSSSYASALRRHLETHSGENSNKCNQCKYA